MVRVLTVHNFTSQHVQTVEQPTASALAPPQRLLLALNNHCIEVRDLKEEANLLFTFPTVDRVIQLVHCLNGDYIATLETKCNRQNRDMNYVRVYVNWDSIATLQQSKMTSSGASLDSSECGMVQPMRARIAGRVTPTTNQSELSSLEMIEIPVRQNPMIIECCQISGNILIQSEKILTIYAFQIKTHDISKLRFVDFEELPIYIEISFVPLKIAFCENYIACLNKDSMHMFKINWKPYKPPQEVKDPEHCDTNFKLAEEDITIDYKELLRKENTGSKDKITVNLPSIAKSNSIIHKHSPFTFTDKEMSTIVRHNFPIEDKNHNYEIIHLIQLKLKPITIKNSQTQVTEEFKCLLVRPFYIDGGYKKSENSDCYKLLKSSYRDCLASVVCMITTLQEGYLFQFFDSDTDTNIDHCISVYPFMGPVYNIVMEDNLLHALTETGLESYTVRTGHKLCRSLEVVDDLSIACPAVEELISLIGHRQFVGIERFLLADNYLVLLANADNSPTHSVGSNSSSTTSYWTLYTLELPTPKTIFSDIAIAANAHRFSAPQTYCHLMSEAHMILRLSLLLIKWNILEGNVCSVAPAKHNVENLVDAYRTSCALLGDHFIMNTNEDYTLCLPYYKMASIASYEVLTRFKRLQEESNIDSMKGILYYLKMVLSESKFRSPETLFKAACKQNFIEEVLAIFENHNFGDLAHLVLKNSMLREYSTCKFINILMHQSYSDPKKETEKLLALALLYVQECNVLRAEGMITCIGSNSCLYQLLLEHWKLLFESSVSSTTKHKTLTSFSEFSVVLMFTNGDILADVFVSLILDKKVSLHNVLWMFLEYLPSRVGSDGNTASTVMQKTLEQYFKNYFANCEVKDLPKFAHDRPSSVQEAIKILVRSYLSQLQIWQLKELNKQASREKGNTDDAIPEDADESTAKEENESKTIKQNHDNKFPFPDKKREKHKLDFLFSDLRHEYLDRMPPFQVEITSKLYETCLDHFVAKENSSPNPKADLVLQKLQAVFCSQVVPKEVISEAHAFLALNETLRGYMSLKSILMNSNEALLFLLDACPQCLLQFGKDRFTKMDEWKQLINNIQKKIMQLSQDLNLRRVCFFYKKLLKDVLTHLATTMHVEQLQQALPQRSRDDSTSLHQTNGDDVDSNNLDVCDDDILNEIYTYDMYITICRETMHANQIKKLITTTGQQLLCTLNL